MIEFNDICKTYRVARRSSGFGNAVKSLFKREYTTIKILSGILTPDGGNPEISKDGNPEADLDHIIARLYEKLDIM